MQEPPWDQLTLPKAVARAAEVFGDRPAIEDGAVQLSFAGLEAAGLEATRAFMAAGVERGHCVAIWAPNLWEWVVAAIGVQGAGGIVVTINTRYKAAEAAYNLRKSRARVLCTLGDFLGTNYADCLAGEELPDLQQVVTLRGDSRRGTRWEDFLAARATVPEAAARARMDRVAPSDPADILFTSGTTGKPKGVVSGHGQNLEVFATWSRGVGLREGDRALIIPPFFHSFGYKAGWLACVLRGATILPQPVYDDAEVCRRIERDRISVLNGPPTIYQSLLAYPGREEHDLTSLRLAVTGAAAIPVELIHQMREVLGFETVITAYGLSESTGTVSMCVPGDDAETIATTSGKAIPDIEVKCVGADGREVPRGEPGEVWVRGYNVMQGYFDDPQATAEAIDAEGWLHTGDVAVMDARGYLRITDRIKDMFIMGGFNCYPAEIENLLFSHEGVAQVAVIGVPDARAGEVGMAFVVPKPGASLDEPGVIAWCREHMANFKVPRYVEVVDALPTNAAGKVTKNPLRERAAQKLGG